MDQVLKETIDKYAPLHELKMQSRMEGINLGLEVAAKEQKRIFQAEQQRLRSLAQKQRLEKQQL